MTEDSYNRKNIKVLKVFASFIIGKCKCGCNKDIPLRSKNRSELRFYLVGHRLIGKKCINYKGEVDTGPYKMLFRPHYPNATKQGYVRKHRLIYEHYLKILFDEDIYIPKELDIHHIIPVAKGGTDALINLEVKTKKEHRRHHGIKDMSDRVCSICGSDKTLMIKLVDLIRPKWYGNKKDGFKCGKCYYLDPIVRKRATQLQKERRKKQRLQINTLDKYSN